MFVTWRHKEIFYHISIYLKITFIALLLTSNYAQAHYSEKYNQQLYKLTLSDPEKALKDSQELFSQAQLSKDVDQQLLALFYMTESLVVLSRPSEIEVVIEQGLQLAIDNNNLIFRTEFLRKRSYQQQLQGHYRKANQTANQALLYANKTSDDRLIAETLATRAEIQLAIQNYDLALIDIKQGLEIFKQYNDFENLSLNYNLLAMAYHSLDDYENAIKYFKEAMQSDVMKTPVNQAIFNYNIGLVYDDKNDLDKAIEYFAMSKLKASQIDDSPIIDFVDFGMAQIYLKQNKYQDVEVVLSPLLKSFKDANDYLMLFNSHLLIAELKIKTEKFDKALTYLNLAEDQLEILNVASAKMDFFNQKIIYYTAIKQWKQALDLELKTKELKSEVDKSSQKKLISELKVKFNAEFDQEKLVLLQKQNELQQSAIMHEKTKQKYLWILILLGLALLLFTYVAYRNQKKIKRHLYNLSITDYLTQVANRRHIMQRLKTLHHQSITQDEKLAIIMIDLDYFKSINDTYGHDVGNEVLIYFAKTAKEVMSGIGEVGRIGGEEWLIVLPNANIELIKKKLHELRLAYKDAISLKIPEDCELSFSSGVLICNGQYGNHEKMLGDVDVAMYRAKDKGREQDVFI